MSDDMIALARRAVACRGWRWMPGMVMLWPSCEVGGFSSWARPLSVSDDGSVNWWEGDPPTEEPDEAWQAKAVPDLTDPATLGCLLALVREAWGGQLVAKLGNGWWEVETDGARWDDANTQSFVEALVAALESAP